MISDEDLESMVGELKVHIPYLNVPDDLRTETIMTPDTCRFYELAHRHFFHVAAEALAWRKNMTARKSIEKGTGEE